MTLEEARKALVDKRAQLTSYILGIDPETEMLKHARAVAEGRLQQINMDLAVLNEIPG